MKSSDYRRMYNLLLADYSIDKAIEEVAIKMVAEVATAAETGSMRLTRKAIVEAHQKWNALAKLEPEFRVNGLAYAFPNLMPTGAPLFDALARDGLLPKAERN